MQAGSNHLGNRNDAGGKAMTDIEEMFKEHDSEFLDYGKHSHLRDVKTQWFIMNMLNNVTPNRDLIIASSRDYIWFATKPETFMECFNQREIVDMIRCGLMYDSEYECLAIFS
jgi:hypothetical protein